MVKKIVVKEETPSTQAIVAEVSLESEHEEDETDSEEEGGFGFGDNLILPQRPEVKTPPKPSQDGEASTYVKLPEVKANRPMRGQYGTEPVASAKPKKKSFWSSSGTASERMSLLGSGNSGGQATSGNVAKSSDPLALKLLLGSLVANFIAVIVLLLATVSPNWGEIKGKTSAGLDGTVSTFGLWSACSNSSPDGDLCISLSNHVEMSLHFNVWISSTGLSLISKSTGLIVGATSLLSISMGATGASAFLNGKWIVYGSGLLQVTSGLIIVTTVASFAASVSDGNFAFDLIGNETSGTATVGTFIPLISLGFVALSCVLLYLRTRRSFEYPLFRRGSNLLLWVLVGSHLFISWLASIGSINYFGYNPTVFAVVLWNVYDVDRTVLFVPVLVLLSSSFFVDIITMVLEGHQIMYADHIAQRLSVVLSGLNMCFKPLTAYLVFRNKQHVEENIFASEPVRVPSNEPAASTTASTAVPTLSSMIPHSYGESPYRTAAKMVNLKAYKSGERSTTHTESPERVHPNAVAERVKAPKQAVVAPHGVLIGYDQNQNSEVTKDAAEVVILAPVVKPVQAPASTALAPADGPVSTIKPVEEELKPVEAQRLTAVDKPKEPTDAVKGGILPDADGDARPIFEMKDDDVFGSGVNQDTKGSGKSKGKGKLSKAERAARREAKRKEEEEAKKKEQAALEAEQARMEVQRFFAEEEARKERKLAKERELRELEVLNATKGDAAADINKLEIVPAHVRRARSISTERTRSSSTDRGSSRTRSLSRDRGGAGSDAGSRRRSGSTNRRRSGSLSLSRSNSMRDLRHTSGRSNDSNTGYDYAGKTFADAITAEVYKRSMESLNRSMESLDQV